MLPNVDPSLTSKTLGNGCSQFKSHSLFSYFLLIYYGFSLDIWVVDPFGGSIALIIPISDGDTKFFYAMKLVPPKDLGSIAHPDTIH